MENNQIKIRSEKIEMVPVGDIVPNQKNRNKHTPEQIDQLERIIKYQGFRIPLIVSARSGLLVAGHGRLMAAKNIGMQLVPVIYQDFENEDQEFAAMVSDNSIASWAELDLSGVNMDIGDLAPDFDISLLGIKNFTVDVSEKTEKQKKPKLCDNCRAAIA